MKTIILIGLVLSSLFPAGTIAAVAPVTMAGNIVNAVPGSPSVAMPITVNGFLDVGQFTLTLKFDTTRVHFISASTNPMLPGMTVSYTPPAGNTQGKLVFFWTNTANVTLDDGSALANLTFSYVSGTGLLNWAYTLGSVCQYKQNSGSTLVTMNDTPKYLYYRNGGISNHGAPATFAPLLPVSAPGPVSLPLTVNNFTGIEALTLYLEYNPALLTYQNTFTKNPLFGSSFQVGNNPGTGGTMFIVIQWYGNPVTLANGSNICTLNFNYTSSSGGICALTFFDNGPSCEFADGSSVLIDLPTADYYHDGVVAPPLVAGFVADKLTPAKYETVSLTDLTSGSPSSWNWSFDRPGVVFMNGTGASAQNPQIQFTDGGLYTVTLVAANSYFSDPEVKTGYIRAGTPGLWAGTNSADWNTPSNWDNYLVPDSSTGVTVPPTASNWPVFDGDLIIGVHCGHLTISGTNSQMTITGDLTIP